MDIVVQTRSHPRPGETVMGKGLHFIPGGKGANQAVAAGRLGGEVALIARVGNDSFGDALLRYLRGEELELSGVRTTTNQPTGTAIIVVDDRSENSIVVVPGSNNTVSIEDLDELRFDGTEIVVCQFEIPQPVVREVFSRARTAGATTVLNPAPAAPCDQDLLDLVDYLVVNETEAAFFAGVETVTGEPAHVVEHARKLQSTPARNVIVTLGAQGVLCLTGEEVIQVPGVKVAAIDTTGAGDCFVGGLVVALSEGRQLDAALQFANYAAALSVQHLGASASLPSRQAVDAFIAQQNLDIHQT